MGRIFEGAGCKLHGLWYAFGAQDGCALMEAPDATTAAGLAIPIGSSGVFASYETTPLLSQAEALEALEVAGGVRYAAPASAAAV